MKTVIATCCALTLGLTCAYGTTAHAATSYDEDGKSLSGAQCQPSFGSQWSDFLTNPDGLRNNSDQNRYISCTIPLDSESIVNQSDADPATAAGSLFVRLIFDYGQVPNNGFSFTTNCTMFNRHRLTSVVSSKTFSVSSPRTTSAIQLVTGFPTEFDGLSGYFTSAGTFSFNCRLPQKVKLTTVQWYENSQTDRQFDTP